MRAALPVIALPAFAAVAACANSADAPNVYDIADVQVVADGGGSVHANACLGAGFLSCSKVSDPVVLVHDTTTTEMLYTGIFVPQFQADAPLGDPTASFVVQSGGGGATVSLPEPFDVAGTPTAVMTPADTLRVSWQPSSAYMQYSIAYQCPDETGDGAERAFRDEGGLALAMSDIDSAIGNAEPDPHATCTIDVSIDRFDVGAITPGFPARSATGIQRRTIELTLQR